jgi:hypothetical protein
MDANKIAPTRYLKDTEAAKVLGLSAGHLRNLRAKGEGPPATRFGRACRYNWRTLLAWAEEQRVEMKD